MLRKYWRIFIWMLAADGRSKRCMCNEIGSMIDHLNRFEPNGKATRPKPKGMKWTHVQMAAFEWTWMSFRLVTLYTQSVRSFLSTCVNLSANLVVDFAENAISTRSRAHKHTHTHAGPDSALIKINFMVYDMERREERKKKMKWNKNEVEKTEKMRSHEQKSVWCERFVELEICAHEKCWTTSSN